MRKIFFIGFLTILTLGCSTSPSQKDTRSAVTETIDSLRNQAKQAREKADFASALQLADQAWDMASQHHDTVRMVQAMNELGTNFRRMGRLLQAIQTHSEALRYTDMCADTSFQARKNVVISWNGLGNALLTLGENNDAELAFRHALNGEIELGSQLGQAINFANLGSICEKRGQLDSALFYYNLSMERNQEIGSVLGIGLCHTYFGGILEKQGNPDAALEEYKSAANLFEGEQDTWHAIEPTFAIANLYLKQGKIPEAAPMITQITEIAEQMHAMEHLVEAYRLQAQMHEMQGHAEAALDSYKQMMHYSDSINNPGHDREMREIVLQYQRRKHLQQLEKEHQEHEHITHLYNLTIVLGCALFIIGFILLGYILHHLRSKMQKLTERFLRLVQQNNKSFSANTLSEEDSTFLEQINNYLEINIEKGNCSIENIAEAMGLSVSSLNRRIRYITGDTAKSYVSNMRMERVITMLQTTNLPLRTVAEKCGFDDMSYFSRSVKKRTGKVPSQLRIDGLK